MGKWDYMDAKDVRNELERIAVSIIKEIDKNEETLTLDDRYMKISGVLALLDGVCEDMDAEDQRDEKSREEFAKSCKATAKAFNDLFEAKVWLTKEDKTDGPAT